MTLCLVHTRNVPSMGEQLIMATDSLITGGFDYPHGTKLLLFQRKDCALCWEGDTFFSYCFCENIRNDIDYSDYLSTEGSDLHGPLKRIVMIANDLWGANQRDKNSNYHNAEFSFIFAGYSYRLKKILAWHVQQDDHRDFRSIEIPELSKPKFIGTEDARKAAEKLVESCAISPYQALVRIIDENKYRNVGGIPQIVTIDRRGVEPIGILKQNRRYLFGRELNSGGHFTKIRYINYDGADL